MDVRGDEEALRVYEMREKALSDWTSGVNHAKREQSREIAEDTGLNMESIKKL